MNPYLVRNSMPSFAPTCYTTMTHHHTTHPLVNGLATPVKSSCGIADTHSTNTIHYHKNDPFIMNEEDQTSHECVLDIERNSSTASTSSTTSTTALSQAEGSRFNSPTACTTRFYEVEEFTTPCGAIAHDTTSSPLTFTFTPLSAQLNPACLSPTPLTITASTTTTPIRPIIPAAVIPQPPVEEPFDFNARFAVQRVLSKTIFGQLKLCADLTDSNKQSVVVKVSEKARMKQRHLGNAVQEDVSKEAIIMRTLGLQRSSTSAEVPAPELTNQHIDPKTCGLSAQYFRTHASHTNPSQLSQDALASISEGKQYLASLVGEFETPTAHYLATDYAARGDLYTVLTEAAGSTRIINEHQGRIWMKQLCQAVQYMHAQSVAHLDLSVENVCIDANGDVKVIDFGLAARHPECQALTFGNETDKVVNTTTLASDTTFTPKLSTCNCSSCYSSVQQLRERVQTQITGTQSRFPGYVAAAVKAAPLQEQLVELPSHSAMEVDDGNQTMPSFQTVLSAPSASSVLASSCHFLMRPICRNICKPGKLSYMATELLDAREQHAPFDGYKADSFSLGVILFILLTGVPPFVKSNESCDTWFRWFISGEWMQERRYSQPVAKHYTRLSPNAWTLIDSCFKPQHVRPSVDQILAHPWFDATHPDSQPLDRLRQ